MRTLTVIFLVAPVYTLYIHPETGRHNGATDNNHKQKHSIHTSQFAIRPPARRTTAQAQLSSICLCARFPPVDPQAASQSLFVNRSSPAKSFAAQAEREELRKQTDSMSNYTSADSPKAGGGDANRYSRLVEETSAAIGSFHQSTRAIMQKMLILGTPQDNRANHQELKELTDKGNQLVAKINKRLQDLYKFTQSGPQARTRKTQVNKLSTDFKNQCKNFEDTCKKLVEAEKAAIAHIRQSSHSFRRDESSVDNESPLELGNYNEDKLYAQANVTTYDEDGAYWFCVEKIAWRLFLNVDGSLFSFVCCVCVCV